MARKKPENLPGEEEQVIPPPPSGDFELQVDMQIPSTQESIQNAARKSISEAVKTVEEQVMQESEEMDLEMSATTERVASHTVEEANEEIRRRTEERVAYYASRLDEIQQRLDELEKEWDIERTLQSNAATLSGVGALFALVFGKKWLILPMAVAGFLLQHSIQGWCPPLNIFRRLGYRTAQEIQHERSALKALRGDFQKVDSASGAEGENLARNSSRALDAVKA